jgi:hypothetical protein
VLGRIQSELVFVPSPFPVEGQRPYPLHMKHCHRIAGWRQVLEISEAPICFDYNNRPHFFPGREMTDYVLDLVSEMVQLEQIWQAMTDTVEPLCWQLK